MWIIMLQKIAMMVLILLLGFYSQRKQYLDNQVTVKLSNFLLMIVNPLVIFVSYQMDYDNALLRNLGVMLLLSAVVFAIQIVIIQLLIPNRQNVEAAVERLSAIYGNCGFIGLPLVNSLFGREGVFYMTAYLTVFYLYFWTHGVILMEGKADLRSTIKNLLSPAIIGVVLGLGCFILRIRLPSILTDAMDSVGSMNTPLAMLVAGATLGQTDITAGLKNKRMYFVSALKLLAVPVIAIVLCTMVNPEPIVAATLVVASGCPVGACCTMFALKYKNDGRYASELFTFSTIASSITLPVLIAITEAFGLL